MPSWISKEAFIAMIEAQRAMEEMLLWGRTSTQVPVDNRTYLKKVFDFLKKV